MKFFTIVAALGILACSSTQVIPSIATHSVAKKVAVTNKIEIADSCLNCISNSCYDETIMCMRIDGCAPLVGCIKGCPEDSANSCGLACMAKATPAARLFARAELACQLEKCRSQCFAD